MISIISTNILPVSIFFFFPHNAFIGEKSKLLSFLISIENTFTKMVHADYDRNYKVLDNPCTDLQSVLHTKYINIYVLLEQIDMK